MKRDLLRKGAQLAYDQTGRLVQRTASKKELYSEETARQFFRLKILEKYYFKWMTVGKDMRINVYAFFMIFVCFGVVFVPANWYDERQYMVQLKGRVPKESLDRSLYEEYLIEHGKKTRFDFDAFSQFHTI